MEWAFRPARQITFGVYFYYTSDLEHWLSTPVSRERAIAVDVLESRNLVRRATHRDLDMQRKGSLSIHYLALTNLGVRFLERVSDNPLH